MAEMAVWTYFDKTFWLRTVKPALERRYIQDVVKRPPPIFNRTHEK